MNIDRTRAPCVFVTDDDDSVREAIAFLLDSEGLDYMLCASADELLDNVLPGHSGCILLDVRMPDITGVEATGLIKQAVPETRVLMLTTFDDDDYVFQSIERGASGYLLKNMNPQRLFSSIRAVMDGSVLVSPSVAQKLFVKSRAEAAKEGAGDRPTWLAELGSSERRVLVRLVKGLSNREIADDVHLSEKTVKNYVSSIYAKIGAPDRFAAMRIAKAAVAYLDSDDRN